MKTSAIKWIILLVLAVTCLGMLLGLEVTTRQGVDYQVRSIRIPLYLKILDFFDRHFNYLELTKRITAQAATEQEKAMAIFEWTYQQIKPQPQDLPIIDDHVWSIIIRGYGAGEQSSDVFTTLCNYAGMDAFYSYVPGKVGPGALVVSFVKIDGAWTIFDLQRGAYFNRADGEPATVKDLAGEVWIVSSLNPTSGDLKGYYHNYIEGIRSFDYSRCQQYSRGNRQSPLKRLVFQLRKMVSP